MPEHHCQRKRCWPLARLLALALAAPARLLAACAVEVSWAQASSGFALGVLRRVGAASRTGARALIIFFGLILAARESRAAFVGAHGGVAAVEDDDRVHTAMVRRRRRRGKRRACHIGFIREGLWWRAREDNMQRELDRGGNLRPEILMCPPTRGNG